MAPMWSRRVGTTVVVALAAERVHASAQASSGQLGRILRGEVSKDLLEIVLAQYTEDVSWSDKYSKVRTVYCKGQSACAPGAVHLGNTGREGHTFLTHIVNNYDRLAKWTVFSQAEEPTAGEDSQRQAGGGHMLSGTSFEDYLVHPFLADTEDPDAFFLMTSKVHMPTLQQAQRSSTGPSGGLAGQAPSTLPAMCPAVPAVSATPPAQKAQATRDSLDSWGPYEDMPLLRSLISDRCGVEETAVGESMLAFWDSLVQLPRPRNDVVHYAKGAIFGVSRDRIRQRPRGFYERLLSLISSDTDACLNYLYEWSWYHILGKPEAAPCAMTQDETAQAWAAKLSVLSAADGASGSSADTNGHSGGSSARALSSDNATTTSTTTTTFTTITATLNKTDLGSNLEDSHACAHMALSSAVSMALLVSVVSLLL